MIPLPWKLGILALVLAAYGASAYVLGRKHVRQAWMAERASVAAEMARLEGQIEERERIWANAMKVAGEKYSERAAQADRNFGVGLDRLRRAYASRTRMPIPTPAPEGCPGPSGPTAADLLRAGETIAGLARDADRDRAALMACVEAWPR